MRLVQLAARLQGLKNHHLSSIHRLIDNYTPNRSIKLRYPSLSAPHFGPSRSNNKMSIAHDIRYLSQDEAVNLDQELFSEYAFSVDQLMELAGLGVASAVAKSYPLDEGYDRPIVCCGPGNNGGDGLVCARHLKLFGYSPTIICPKPGKSQLYQNLLVQCRKFEIPILDTVTSDEGNENFNLHSLGNLVIDAIFGFSYKPPNRNADFATLLRSIHQLKASNSKKQMPLVCIDIPSGWHVELGPTTMDSDQANTEAQFRLPALEPDCLVSLTAPKMCASHFKGRYHYLSGRFCPKSLLDKYRLNLPQYPGTEGVILLSGSR